jgi:hypothetical protein
MTFLKLANVGWVALFAAMAGSASNACSNTPPPPEQAFVAGDIGPGNMDGINDSAACGQGDLTWTLGNAVSPSPVLYANGSTQVGAGTVQVNCSVDQSGNGFNVQLAAELQGQLGGTIFVSGVVNATGDTTGGLSGSFSTMGQTFIDHNCSFTQTYNNSPLPNGGMPASGRIWGHIDCPHAQSADQEGLGADGGQITRTCDARADVLFQNCN